MITQLLQLEGEVVCLHCPCSSSLHQWCSECGLWPICVRTPRIYEITQKAWARGNVAEAIEGRGNQDSSRVIGFGDPAGICFKRKKFARHMPCKKQILIIKNGKQIIR